MKKLGFLIAGVSLFLNGALFASVRPCPGEFSFTAEWVYLDPIIDNPFYAQKVERLLAQNSEEGLQGNDTSCNGNRFANELDYHSGFRLEAMYAFCDCMTDFRLAWTHFTSDHKDRKKARVEDGFFLLPTNGLPIEDDNDNGGNGENDNALLQNESLFFERGSSKIDFDFDRVEGLFGYRLLNCGCLDLVLEGGLQYANFETKNRNKFRAPPVPVTESEEGTPSVQAIEGGDGEFLVYAARSCYWGIGPQIGFDLNYCLCGDFSFVATANWALLVGENDTKSFLAEVNRFNGMEEKEVFVKSKNECIWRIVPATHIRAGFNYGYDCGCWDFNIEAGYQFYSYVRALDTIEFVDDQNPGRSLDIYSNADLHGPYVAVTFNF